MAKNYVLIDSSVWISYLKNTASLDFTFLEELILRKECATCHAIISEVLAGRMDKTTRQLMESGFSAMRGMDVDWSNSFYWSQMIKIADRAITLNKSAAGVVDRMILVNAKNFEISIYTYDKALIDLALLLKIKTIQI